MNFTPNSLGGSVSRELAGRQRPVGPPGDDRAEHQRQSDARATLRRRPSCSIRWATLTNRENRYAAPRFTDDFVNFATGSSSEQMVSRTTSTATRCPTFTRRFTPTCSTPRLATQYEFAAAHLRTDTRHRQCHRSARDSWRFPTFSRGVHVRRRFSRTTSSAGSTRRRPCVNDQASANTYQFDTAPLWPICKNINHNPLDLGDNLPIPDKNHDADRLLVAAADVVGLSDLARERSRRTGPIRPGRSMTTSTSQPSASRTG